jgi:general secretion pathway protein E
MIAGMPPKPIAPVGRLPFAFAKRHGVLVRGVVEGKAQVVYREGAQPSAVAELRRFLGIPLVIERVAESAFDELLRKAYEGGSGEAGQIVEGIEGETDLAGLAEGLPEPSDLMESEDDAPSPHQCRPARRSRKTRPTSHRALREPAVIRFRGRRAA